MAGWTKVSTLEELNQFLRTVGGFHDGILKEIHWVNRDHIEPTLCMLSPRGSDAHILVQRQWKKPSAVELYLEGVQIVHVDTAEWIYGAKGSIEDSPIEPGESIQLLVLHLDASKLKFERMQWRDASEWMGVDSRFGAFSVPNWEED